MIKRIIACADVHVPALAKMDEYKETLVKFIDQCKEIVEEEGSESVRIVVAGDIFQGKITITNESITTVNWFFSELDKLCKTYVCAGNHDLLQENLDRMDSLSPLFEIGKYNQVIYMDKELGYNSGYIVDDDCVFCLYSIFAGFSRPDVEALGLRFPDKYLIGVIHGDVNGAVSPTTYVTEDGLDPKVFDNLNFVIAGHIHKHQEIRSNGVPVVYCSSMRQKDFGESITGHGFVLWKREAGDEEFEYEFTEVDNSEGGFFKFSVSCLEDIENDEEELINL